MSERLDDIIYSQLNNLPAEPYVCWQKTWWLRSAFSDIVEECILCLKRSGFKSGQRLALLLPNSPIALALTVAAWKLGGAVVPVDYRMGYVALIKQLCHADIFGAVTFRGCSELVPLISEEGIPCIIEPLDALGADIPGRPTAIEDEETAIIFYTSGITGEPKAVPLTHKNIISCITSCLEQINDLNEDDVFLNALPNYNAFGLICGAVIGLMTGTRQAILPSFIPSGATLEAMRNACVSVMPAVPTMITILLGAVARGGAKLKDLRYIISGGDRLPEHVAARAKKSLGVPVLEGYGLTEASSVVSIAPGADRIKPGTVGKLISCVEADVRGEDGVTLPAGSAGHLWIRGASVAKNYYRNPTLTAKRFVDGWFDTCDIAKFDEDGYLSLVARTTEVIFVGGFKVYPVEVERVLREHPAVKEAAVVGVPRSISGELVKAYIVPQNGCKVTTKELIESCKRKLSYYKVPRIVEFVDKLPHSATGEILKRRLGGERYVRP